MRIQLWLGALATFFFCACGGDDSGGDARDAGDGTGEHPSASGHLLWSATTNGPFLRGIETGSGEVRVGVLLTEGSAEIHSMDVAGGQVWLGTDDGSVVVVSESAEKIERTLNVADAADFIEHVAVGGGSGYVAFGEQVDPHVLRIDAHDFQTKADEPVVRSVDWISGMLFDGENVFVLGGNAFAVSKLDPMTLETQAVAGLGALDSNPNVLSPEHFGNGFMTHVGQFLWVVDTFTDRLLRVDKRTMVATVVSDLSDILEPESYTEIGANDSDFFLSIYDMRKIVRFDGTTGARIRTYEPEGGTSAMAVSAEKLYVSPTDKPERILEIDIESGKVTHTFEDLKVALLAVE